MSLANRLIFITGLFLTVLILTNPGELKYLKTIGSEYGSMHHGITFPPARLLEIGEGKRVNFIFASKYRYEFGNISVEYMGFAGMVFKTEIDSVSTPDVREEEADKIIV